jgi:hypothetical protein
MSWRPRHCAHCDADAHGIVEEKACRLSAWPAASCPSAVIFALQARRDAHQNGLRYPKQCKQES